MLLDVPVISVILDGEKNFKMYEDAVEYVCNIDQLKKMLNILLNYYKTNEDWIGNQIRKQYSFLEKYFDLSHSQPSIFAAKVIDDCISD
jgi:hypothetical protein